MDDSLHEYKMRFALLLQRVNKDQRLSYAPVIAKQVVGKEAAAQYPTYVCQIAEEWPFDDVVVAEIDRLDSQELTTAAYLAKIMAIHDNPYTENQHKLEALKLYGLATGRIKGGSKEGTTTNELLSHLQAVHHAVTNPVDT